MGKTWLERDEAAIWHPFTQLVEGFPPLMLEKAEGVWLHTEDGRKILDAISSWWVNLHGHSHPYIAEKVAEQAAKLEHVIFAGFTHEPAITLAERLLKVLPENQSKIFYSDNGSTACEVGLKMAFQYWHNVGQPKQKVVAFEGAYHGDTFGAMSVGDRGPFTAPFNPWLFEVEFLPFPTLENEAEVVQHFEKLTKDKEVAAFIYEPLVLGSAGMKMYRPELLEQLLQIAKQNEVITIADEVFTGFGRTGKDFSSEYMETQPDIMCLSKGLTGGTMALGVTSCTERIIEAYRTNELLKTFFHGHSFTANPIACAAALASLDLFEGAESKQQRTQIASWQRVFAETIEKHSQVRNVRTLGTIMALDINTEESTSYVNEVRHKLYPYFLNQDILLRPLGNVLYILPPYVIQQEELQTVYDAVTRLMDDLAAGKV